ncbi:hypothetical protein BC749_103387 [Flavobacterium araucananum]|uniref:Uncharacterized protein n=1 Tax=Flavobacterium araucananum TaxID=946678 RepID=A0A227P2X7_9FLAO|nr:hypothetical protein [Flavobacterium araucananum]OXG04300.1 hypothetical protein B0A64_15690 [Flavobacterium araucananum]PWK00003.1 hypothetical protein BC749_103387 [Flavobacterium araucananum]
MIRIATFEDNNLLPFKEINQKQYDRFQTDCTLVQTVYTQYVVFKYLQLNLKEYFDFIKRWEKVPANEMHFTLGTDIHFILHSNKLVLNVLIGFKFFLDNAEVYLKRKFGKNSYEVQSHIDLTRYCFDNSFAYRFLSKLRNYCAHLGFPLEVVNFDIEFKDENPEISEHSCKLILYTKMLKKERDLFGKIVMSDLEKIDNEIDLIPLIKELTNSINVIQKNIYLIQQAEIEEAIENIDFFVGTKKTATNEIKVYHNYSKIDNKISFEVFHVPMEIIEELNHYKEKSVSSVSH